MLKPGLKIAISGKSGCGNSTVSRLLSQTLGLRMINYTFRNMAQEEGLELRELCRLAEKDFSWDKKLDKKQVEMAAKGDCVLGSRLAIWLLKEADLKVYLTASPEVRAKRIFQREGGVFEAVLAETIDRDKRDHDRYQKIYDLDNDDFSFVDLVIDTTVRKPEMVLEDIIFNLKIKKLF